jgi:LAGLIDADG DNA endonuclease family
MAVWIMDDGAIDGRQLRINMQSFTIEEVQALAEFVERRFGRCARVNLDKGKPRLRFAESGMTELLEHVRPHMHPTMLYKLRPD